MLALALRYIDKDTTRRNVVAREPARRSGDTARMASAPGIQVRIRIDFAAGPSLGPGKVTLLEQIALCGSLSAAARALRLSYRRAWLMMDDINRSFSEPAVVAATGGRRGGGARVTPFGHELVRRYRLAEQVSGRQVARVFRGLTAPRGTERAGLRRPLVRGIARRK